MEAPLGIVNRAHFNAQQLSIRNKVPTVTCLETAPSWPPPDSNLEAVRLCQKETRAPHTTSSGSSSPFLASIALAGDSSLAEPTFVVLCLVLSSLETYGTSHILCVLSFVTDKGEVKRKTQMLLRNPNLQKWKRATTEPMPIGEWLIALNTAECGPSWFCEQQSGSFVWETCWARLN